MKHKYAAAAALLLWIIFIFCRSLKPAEISSLESQWVLELLQRLCPFDLSMRVIRKLAHFTEFAILGALAGLLFEGWFKGLFSGLLLAVMAGVIIALCDETIQLFVPGRTGRVPDVWLDIAGAFTGAVLALAGRAVVRRVCGGGKRDIQLQSRGE